MSTDPNSPEVNPPQSVPAATSGEPPVPPQAAPEVAPPDAVAPDSVSTEQTPDELPVADLSLEDSAAAAPLELDAPEFDDASLQLDSESSASISDDASRAVEPELPPIDVSTPLEPAQLEPAQLESAPLEPELLEPSPLDPMPLEPDSIDEEAAGAPIQAAAESVGAESPVDPIGPSPAQSDAFDPFDSPPEPIDLPPQNEVEETSAASPAAGPQFDDDAPQTIDAPPPVDAPIEAPVDAPFEPEPAPIDAPSAAAEGDSSAAGPFGAGAGLAAATAAGVAASTQPAPAGQPASVEQPGPSPTPAGGRANIERGVRTRVGGGERFLRVVVALLALAILGAAGTFGYLWFDGVRANGELAKQLSTSKSETEAARNEATSLQQALKTEGDAHVATKGQLQTTAGMLTSEKEKSAGLTSDLSNEKEAHKKTEDAKKEVEGKLKTSVEELGIEKKAKEAALDEVKSRDGTITTLNEDIKKKATALIAANGDKEKALARAGELEKFKQLLLSAELGGDRAALLTVLEMLDSEIAEAKDQPQAIKLCSLVGPTWFRLGLDDADSRQKAFDQARSHAERVVAANPAASARELLEAMFILGRIAEERDQFDQARTAFEQGVAQASKLEADDSRFQLGVLRVKAKQRDAKRATAPTGSQTRVERDSVGPLGFLLAAAIVAVGPQEDLQELEQDLAAAEKLAQAKPTRAAYAAVAVARFGLAEWYAAQADDAAKTKAFGFVDAALGAIAQAHAAKRESDPLSPDIDADLDKLQIRTAALKEKLTNIVDKDRLIAELRGKVERAEAAALAAEGLAKKRVAQEQNWADWSANLAESFGFTTLMPNVAKRWSDVAPSRQLADWRSGWQDRIKSLEDVAASDRAERDRLQRGEAHWAEQSLELARVFGFVRMLPDQDSRWSDADTKTAAWIAELFGKIKASREENEDPSKLEFALPYYIRGREAYFAGDLSAAERHLSRAIAIYPHDARFFYVRAIVRYDIATLSPLAPSEAVRNDESEEIAAENVTAANGRRATLPSDSDSGTEFIAATARANATALPRTARRAETAPCDCGTPCPTFVDRRPRHWPALPALTQSQKDERWLDAKSDACQAANLERKKKPKAYLIHEALEKIQGERRSWLEDLRNNPLLCRPAEERQAAAR